MRKKFLSVTLLLGILVAILTGILIKAEERMVVYYLLNDPSYKKIVDLITNVCSILLGLWIIRRFKDMKTGRLKGYIILSVIVAIVVVFFMIGFGTTLFGRLIINKQFFEFTDTRIGSFVVFNIVCIVNALGIAIFLFVLSIFINRKVKYINYISKEIRKIEVEGFGRCIEVRGEDELTDLCTTINKMSTTLKEKLDKEKQMERQKNELITNISHDLRTPLTSIIGYVDLIKELKPEDVEAQKEYVAVVERRLKGLNTMINELFEYTKLTSFDYPLNLIKMDLVPLIIHMFGEYEIIYKKAGFRFKYHKEVEEGVCEADMEKIVRVMQNLLENAKKYGRPNSIIEAEVGREADFLVVKITNETDMIKEEEVDELFERFYKADKSRTDGNGSGLGLCIARQIMELHYGTIDAFYNKNKITFTVKIPAVF